MHIIMALLALALLPAQATAQEHWSCDTHAYRYDMTLYVALMEDGKEVTDYSDYEVAAFVGDECRGVVQPMTVTHDGETFYLGYLRVRSNKTKDETLDFKLYSRTTGQEVKLAYTTPFVTDTMEGLPSSPIRLYRYLLGDSNGDGDVSLADIMLVVNYILSEDSTGLIFMNSDIDISGDISLVDIMGIVDIILN